ncbi:cd7 antigen-like [Polymixia lowei]
MDIRYLPFMWIFLITQTRLVCADVQFLERNVGESVFIPCASDQNNPSPFAVYLKRTWLRVDDVLFMLSSTKPTIINSDDDQRITVSGDPGTGQVNVTIAKLRETDTDRYYCEFFVEGSPVDRKIPGKTEFFLYVSADASESLDVTHVEACAGGSADLPCLPPRGDGSAVAGVSLQRRKGRSPAEVLYRSTQHRRGTSSASFSPPSSSDAFPSERLRWSTAPGAGGISYNVSLLRLQPEDSGFYSCKLLVPGRTDGGAGLGRHVVFVSVQGVQCSCSNYTTLLYILSVAAALLFFILIGLLLIYRGKSHDRVKPQPQVPIYEEMVGVKSRHPKKAPCHPGDLHLEEPDTSVYCNSLLKSRPENHYETSNGAYSPLQERQK